MAKQAIFVQAPRDSGALLCELSAMVRDTSAGQLVTSLLRPPARKKDLQWQSGVAHSGRTGEAQVADDRESLHCAAAVPQF